MKFGERVDERGNRQMGVWVLPGVTIAKGQELLLSYGKGYWRARCGGGRDEWEEAEAAAAAAAAALGACSIEDEGGDAAPG